MASGFLPMLISNLLAGVTALIGIFNLFTLREALMIIIMASPISVWSWRVIDIAIMIVIGIVWIIVVFLSQSNYDKGYRQKTLLKVFSLVTGYQALLFFIASMIVHLLDSVSATSQNIIITVVQAIFAAGLLIYACKDSFVKCLNLKI